MNRNLAAALLGALAVSAASAANAAVTQLQFSAPGAAPEVHFTGLLPDSLSVDPGLSATFNVKLNSISADGYSWQFSYQLANTSSSMSRLSVIGWDIDPDIANASAVSGVFTNWASDANMASLGPVEFCLKNTSGASCSGGGGGGLFSGVSGSGDFTLVFTKQLVTYTYQQSPVYNPKGKLIRYETIAVPHVSVVAAPSLVTFNNFGLRFQALEGGGSTVGVPGDRPTLTAVPEPSQWALLLTGFFGAGAALRLRRRLASKATAAMAICQARPCWIESRQPG